MILITLLDDAYIPEAIWLYLNEMHSVKDHTVASLTLACCLHAVTFWQKSVGFTRAVSLALSGTSPVSHLAAGSSALALELSLFFSTAQAYRSSCWLHAIVALPESDRGTKNRRREGGIWRREEIIGSQCTDVYMYVPNKMEYYCW